MCHCVAEGGGGGAATALGGGGGAAAPAAGCAGSAGCVSGSADFTSFAVSSARSSASVTTPLVSSLVDFTSWIESRTLDAPDLMSSSTPACSGPASASTSSEAP